MYKIFFTQVAVLLQILVEILAENKTETVQELENEKENLFQNINSAIDESVRLLKNDNDTNAALGVTYMQTLKDQLKEINSDFKDKGAVDDIRRSNKLNLNILELASIFQKDKSKQLKRDENKITVQKKLEDWIMERNLEKQKIHEYKVKQKLSIATEDCPRFGLGKKKNKELRRSNGKKPLPKYPCCRKCCKSSYMGCL